MLFEFTFIRKYLTPQKKQLSVSLIALLSVTMITLVVWLVVVFLSVTEGIERNWLQKLTALNAPIRIQPTPEYFSSYYYNVDRYSAASHYLSKTIGEKAHTLISNPYDPEFDEEIPQNVAKPDLDGKGNLKDPVKEVIAALDELKLNYEDVEMSGALLRLDLVRQELGTLYPNESQSHLTHASYLASFPEKNPSLPQLLIPPSEEDLNHLLFLAKRHGEDSGPILAQVKIEKFQTAANLWPLPLDLLPEKVPFLVEAYEHHGEISHILLPDVPSKSTTSTMERRGDRLFFKAQTGPEIPLDRQMPLYSQGDLELDVVQILPNSLFSIRGKLQQKPLAGTVGLNGLKVTKALFDLHAVHGSAPWPMFRKNKVILPESGNRSGILIAKNFRENGVKIGDEGYLSYSAPTISGAKEHKLPIYVAGFYDPGIMAVGNKCILVPHKITQTINASEHAFTLDRSETNHLFVWLPNLNQTAKIKEAILQKLQEKGIENYWKVQTFREYDFAKDLMQQFESDKYLFTLVAMIILLVACTNIISLLILLVSDKKKEIGILRAMGAKRRSIAAIFALSGAGLGLFSCLLGVFLAFVTLKNIDHVVSFLSVIQGHQAFNPQFFGPSLPHEMSSRALLFAAIATPILALLAGIIPAIKAARLDPCETLRSE